MTSPDAANPYTNIRPSKIPITVTKIIYQNEPVLPEFAWGIISFKMGEGFQSSVYLGEGGYSLSKFLQLSRIYNVSNKYTIQHSEWT